MKQYPLKKNKVCDSQVLTVNCLEQKCERIVFLELRDNYDVQLFLAFSSWGPKLRFEAWSLKDREQKIGDAT